MRHVWLSLLVLLYSSSGEAEEHRWYFINDTDAACAPLSVPPFKPQPVHPMKTPAHVLAYMQREWPDARLVPLVDLITERHIRLDSLPVDFARITKANALVVTSATLKQEVLLLRDDACWKIDAGTE